MKRLFSLMMALLLVWLMVPAGTIAAGAAGESYSIQIVTTGNGTVTANPSPAEAEEYVTVTMTAESGWFVKEMLVTTADVQITKITYTTPSFEEDVDGFTMPAENVTLHVTFAQEDAFDEVPDDPTPHDPDEPCAVVFDANGGEGEMEQTSVDYGGEITLLDCGFTKTGRDFYRWEVNGFEYNPGDSLCLYDDVTVKAVWKHQNAVQLDYSSDDSTTNVKGVLLLHDLRTEQETIFTVCGMTMMSDFTQPYNDEVSAVLQDAESELYERLNTFDDWSNSRLTVSDPSILSTTDNRVRTYYDDEDHAGYDENGDYFEKSLITEGSYSHEWQITVTLEADYVSVPMSYIHVLTTEGGWTDFWCDDYDGDYSQPYAVPEGAEVTLTATPKPKYRFIGWYKGDVNASSYEEMFTDELITTENPYVFEAYEYPYICAKFEYTGIERQGDQIQVWITDGGKASVQYTPTWDDDGYIKPKDGNHYVGIGEVVPFWKGDSITVNAKPDNGYVFKGWYHVNIEWGPGNGEKYEGEVISTDSSFTYLPGVTVVEGDEEPLRYVCAVFEPSYKIGDVNGDGIVSIRDVTEIQRIVAELYPATELQKITADVNGDGVIDINDATEIQFYLAEMIDAFGRKS